VPRSSPLEARRSQNGAKSWCSIRDSHRGSGFPYVFAWNAAYERAHAFHFAAVHGGIVCGPTSSRTITCQPSPLAPPKYSGDHGRMNASHSR